MTANQNDARQENFDRIRKELAEQGYHETPAIISMVKANVLAIIISVVVVVLGAVAYLAIWHEFAISGSFFIVMFVGLLVSVVIHELLHGLGWGLFCKQGFKSIRFGVMWKYLAPYCHCTEPLAFGPYLFGGLLPLVVLGVIPFVISLIIGNETLLGLALINIIAASGDIMIVGKLLKYRDALIIDHPSEGGFYAFTKHQVG